MKKNIYDKIVGLLDILVSKLQNNHNIKFVYH